MRFIDRKIVCGTRDALAISRIGSLMRDQYYGNYTESGGLVCWFELKRKTVRHIVRKLFPWFYFYINNNIDNNSFINFIKNFLVAEVCHH